MRVISTKISQLRGAQLDGHLARLGQSPSAYIRDLIEADLDAHASMECVLDGMLPFIQEGDSDPVPVIIQAHVDGSVDAEFDPPRDRRLAEFAAITGSFDGHGGLTIELAGLPGTREQGLPPIHVATVPAATDIRLTLSLADLDPVLRLAPEPVAEPA